ncbi:hypothetical protein CAter282_2755 [Collimonas arenae]|uniref:Uncharacterized protein n=1 Tax=Collimonas arenae TaxID=279058 RepID=A0A127QKD3_9BURK|nr:hypothetical protein CAter10_3034 [Collimonas arenae]AMP10483.1 hypothetical protein CAter282_2755 [Collimonas arenae]
MGGILSEGLPQCVANNGGTVRNALNLDEARQALPALRRDCSAEKNYKK